MSLHPNTWIPSPIIVSDKLNILIERLIKGYYIINKINDFSCIINFGSHVECYAVTCYDKLNNGVTWHSVFLKMMNACSSFAQCVFGIECFAFVYSRILEWGYLRLVCNAAPLFCHITICKQYLRDFLFDNRLPSVEAGKTRRPYVQGKSQT